MSNTTTDRCPECEGTNISYGGGRAACCGTCGHIGDEADFEVPEPFDYAGKRVGSAHVETIRNGHSICEVCGDVVELDPESEAARQWHGDSFDPVLRPLG